MGGDTLGPDPIPQRIRDSVPFTDLTPSTPSESHTHAGGWNKGAPFRRILGLGDGRGDPVQLPSKKKRATGRRRVGETSNARSVLESLDRTVLSPSPGLL